MFPLCLNELQTSTGHYNSRIPAQLRRDACHFPLHKLRLESPVRSIAIPAPALPFPSPLISHGEPFHRIPGFRVWESEGCFYYGSIQKVAPLCQVFYKHSSKGSSLPWRVSAFGKRRLIGKLNKQGFWGREWDHASPPTQVEYREVRLMLNKESVPDTHTCPFCL